MAKHLLLIAYGKLLSAKQWNGSSDEKTSSITANCSATRNRKPSGGASKHCWMRNGEAKASPRQKRVALTGGIDTALRADLSSIDFGRVRWSVRSTRSAKSFRQCHLRPAENHPLRQLMRQGGVPASGAAQPSRSRQHALPPLEALVDSRN
jgi:hypothetical protein